MAPPRRSIRDFFKPVQFSSPNLANDAEVGDDISGTEDGALPPSSSRIIRSSDDEDSNSNCSLEDLTDLLQFQNTTQHINPNVDGLQPTKNSRTRSNVRRGITSDSPKAIKPKYKFDMKALIKQNEKYEAAEASALSLKALLRKPEDSNSVSQRSGHGAAHDSMLESVIAEREGTSIEKVLQAVKRTEAVQAEMRCHLFDLVQNSGISAGSVPTTEEMVGWKKGLSDSCLREHLLLSDFARDMVNLGDVLPDNLFLWMLREICIERRHDLREAYGRVVAASRLQIRKLVGPEIIGDMFQKLGVKKIATNTQQVLELNSAECSPYEGQNWIAIRSTIAFLGQISSHLSELACSYIIRLLARLCVDTVILESIGLLAALQKTMEQASQSISVEFWEQSCREICTSTYYAVEQAALRFQILRCMPRCTPRTHEIRRRLAFAFFFEDVGYSTSPPHRVIDIWELTKRLDEPQFRVNKDSDYHQLAALMSVLDIAIDNALGLSTNPSNPEDEQEFNIEVDALAARIREIWSSINDAGASFMSRIDAKEVMEGLRHRLIYAVRTKPVPKKGIFDTVLDDKEEVRKQSELMSRYFGKSKSDSS